jgi:hypothetical protein
MFRFSMCIKLSIIATIVIRRYLERTALRGEASFAKAKLGNGALR